MRRSASLAKGRLTVSQLLIIPATTLAWALIISLLDCGNSLLTGFLRNSHSWTCAFKVSLQDSFSLSAELIMAHLLFMLRCFNVPPIHTHTPQMKLQLLRLQLSHPSQQHPTLLFLNPLSLLLYLQVSSGLYLLPAH